MGRIITELAKEQIKNAILESPLSMMNAAKIVGIPFNTFRYRAKKLNLYKTNQSGKGVKQSWDKKRKDNLNDILTGRICYKSSGSNLKWRLVDAGIKENKCEDCGLPPVWNNKSLSLELDHIDGHHDNWTQDNLRILCPNCHSQTATHGAGNRGKHGFKSIKEIPLEKIKEAFVIANDITNTARKLGLNHKNPIVRKKLKELRTIFTVQQILQEKQK